jgi:hypothetical protein
VGGAAPLPPFGNRQPKFATAVIHANTGHMTGHSRYKRSAMFFERIGHSGNCLRIHLQEPYITAEIP